MARFVRTSFLLALAGVFVASAAMANIPDPNLSDVPPNLLIAPDGQLTYSVQVVGPLGPINGANVEVRVGALADPLVTWCAGQSHPSIVAVSNASGVATFNIAGGGCVDANRFATADIIFQVFADGVEIGRVDAANTAVTPGAIVSPDVVNNNGELPTDAGYLPDALAQVGLADAVFHTGPIVSSALNLEICTDLELTARVVDGQPIDVGDASTVTPYIVQAISCSP